MEAFSEPSHGLGVCPPSVLKGADPFGQSGADALIPLALESCDLVLELSVPSGPPRPHPRDDLANEREGSNGDGEGISSHRPTCPLQC